jgi:pyruvate formate lyase activating enzyme
MSELESSSSSYPARWWHREGERFRCDLCPRFCILSPGQRGFCFVREANRDGMVLTTYGRSSGFCVDPIEKKPLHHFHPGTPVLSFGTAGCNLGCRYCQNWDMSKSRDIDRLAERASPEQIATAACALGCASVAFTYNDPVVFAEYAIDTADACRAAGLHPVAVTAGYVTAEARAELFGAMHAANIDLKGFTEEYYHRQCLGHLQPVLETIEYVVKHTRCWVELTTLVIPGLNDGNDELERLSTWVHEHLGPDVPLHFTAFHPDYKLRDLPPTPRETLVRARDIARANGLRYVYTGNIDDVDGASTHCPGCGLLLVERRGYRIATFAIVDGSCRRCGVPIAGHFDAQPGRWGARRLPISMAFEEPHAIGGEHETA